MSRRTLLLVALVLGAALSLSLGSLDTSAAEPLGAGGKAPDFPKLRDMAGVEFDTEKDLKGKLTLVNFWATWCQPCMVEMKHLDRLHKAYKDKGYQVVSVSIDDARTFCNRRCSLRRICLAQQRRNSKPKSDCNQPLSHAACHVVRVGIRFAFSCSPDNKFHQISTS